MGKGEIQPTVNAAVGRALRGHETFYLFDGPFLEMILVTIPQVPCAFQSMRYAFNLEIFTFDQSQTVFKPDTGHALDGVDCNINTDPLAAEIVGSFHRGRTSAEGIKNNVTFV